ncbi:MAG TPA: type II toxin-antitoxin system prevent-host-death family antitoxin [Thermomicrobiales bacterium]|nr:type II toxin-antitoxin system prevent-host-death family antitoxin [Thermomicrobiales bacterium]
MSSIGVRELKAHASQILRRVEEEGEVIDVTRRGAVIARLVPVERPVDRVQVSRVWEERDRLAEEIAKHWPAGLSAADAIAEDRE